MKKAVFLAFLLLCLAPIIACAEAHPTLFPAVNDQGKWGYVDLSRNWAIEPRFDRAGGFRGNYADVSIYPEGSDPSDDELMHIFGDCDGIIDQTGAFVLPPEYSLDSGYDGEYYGGRDTGIWTVTKWKDVQWGEDEDGEEIVLQFNRYGFFDIPSGCFSGLKWLNIGHWCSDSRLIAVIDENGAAGYADRSTGEEVIPCQYFSSDAGNFEEGIAAVAFMDEDGNSLDFFLINESGQAISLPEGIHAVQYHGASEGLVLICRQDEENGKKLYGYADQQGKVVIPPQFLFGKDFSDGFASVLLNQDEWGLIDHLGHVIHRKMQNRP